MVRICSVMLRMFVYKMHKFLLLLLIFMPIISVAETRFVSIKECIEIGIQNSPDVAIELENKKIAQAGKKIVESAKKPYLAFEARTITDKIDTDAEENERYKTDQKNKVDIIKFIIIAITTLIIAGMLILTPATMDIRNVSESKSEVVTDVSDR